MAKPNTTTNGPPSLNLGNNIIIIGKAREAIIDPKETYFDKRKTIKNTPIQIKAASI